MCQFVCLFVLVFCLLFVVMVFVQVFVSVDGDCFEVWFVFYIDYCGVCYGDDLCGEVQGMFLVGVDLKYGDVIEELVKMISEGVLGIGMEVFGEEFMVMQIQMLVIFIVEECVQMIFVDFKVVVLFEVLIEFLLMEFYDFCIEIVIDDIDLFFYLIVLLLDGCILFIEKMCGLSVILFDGKQLDLFLGVFEGYDDVFEGGVLCFGNGWIFDVVFYLVFVDNGWIYFLYGDCCDECNEISCQVFNLLVLVFKLICGCIQGGEWVDEEIIWEIGCEYYVFGIDMVVGGWIVFDYKGYFYFSFGMMFGFGYQGIQDLDCFYGKVYCMYDDGWVFEDNFFVLDLKVIGIIWIYGYCSLYGFEFDCMIGEFWEMEMGLCGGDEVNLLQLGKNYGWLIVFKGVYYNGKKVDGVEFGIEVDFSKIEQLVVDFMLGVVVLSFVIYDGDVFFEWCGQLFVGLFKGWDFYCFEMEDGIFKQ